MAALTYTKVPTGFTTRAGTPRSRHSSTPPPPDLWPLFGALAHVPLLLVWGEVSDILLAETVDAMRAVRPDMEVVSLSGIGHAPTAGRAAGAAGD